MLDCGAQRKRRFQEAGEFVLASNWCWEGQSEGEGQSEEEGWMDTEGGRWQGWTAGSRLWGRSECGSEEHWPQLKMHVWEKLVSPPLPGKTK